MRIPWRWLFIGLILFGAWRYWHERPVIQPAEIVAADSPVQTSKGQGKTYAHGDYQLEVLASFDIEARVLSKEIYHVGRESDLSPVDLALGWGPMSDSSVLDSLTISQGGRFYYYHWDNEPPIPPSEIARHSANMHLIPTDAALDKRMREARVGQVVHITGQLVEARAPDGWHWRSSLTRDDTGNGACELIRVESIEFR